MGLLDLLFQRNKTPKVESILPAIAIREIQNGRLPMLNTQRLFLKNGEQLSYMDNAVYQKQVKVRVTNRRSHGYRMPGLFSGTSFITGGGRSEARDAFEVEQIPGTLFITNQRLVFSSGQDGFVVPLKQVVGMKTYTNAVELQLDRKVLSLFVPDGGVVEQTLQLMR